MREMPADRRPLRLIAAALAALALTVAAPGTGLAATGSAPSAPDGCADVVVSTRSFDVTMEAQKKTYRAGETARIHLTVTRPAREDPAGLGVGIGHPLTFPASDVAVGVGLFLKGAFLAASNATDQEGVAVIEIDIPRKAPTGKVEASGFAWETHFRGACLIVEEFGHRKDPKLFRIKGGKRR